jgi:hypothetical protein
MSAGSSAEKKGRFKVSGNAADAHVKPQDVKSKNTKRVTVDRGFREKIAAGKANRERLHEKTFRGWVNKTLSKADRKDQVIDNLIQDFNDGVRLAALVEVLTKGPIDGKIRQQPKLDVHRIENIALVLARLKEDLPNLNVDANQIAACESVAILGFVWQLIVHYQILHGEGFTDEEAAAAAKQKGNIMKKAREKVLAWWREQLEEYDDVDITTVELSFNDGKAFCALMHRLDPTLCDYPSLDKDDEHVNLAMGFKLAEEHLGIWPLLDVDDMLDEDEGMRPDEQCILTYISEFPSAFAKKFDAAAHRRRREEEIASITAESEAMLRQRKAELEAAKEAKDAEERRLAEERAAAIEATGNDAEQLLRDAEERKAAEVERIRAEQLAKQALAMDSMAALQEENEARIAELERETQYAAELSAAEIARLRKEKEDELERLRLERETLEQLRQDETDRIRREADEAVSQKEREMANERAEAAAQAKLTAEQFAKWKMQRLRDLEDMKRERDAATAAIRREIERLRRENELLRRGVPHNFQKDKLSGTNWCSCCRSFIWGNKAHQCSGESCKYVVCNRCFARGAPNNCLASLDDMMDNDSTASANDNDALDAAPVVHEGYLQRKNVRTGRWQKVYMVVKSGVLLEFVSEKDAKRDVSKRKQLFLLRDVQLVRYSKADGKKHGNAFGIEAKHSVLWLETDDEDDKEEWLALLNSAIINTQKRGEAEERVRELLEQSAAKTEEIEKVVRATTGSRMKRKKTAGSRVSRASVSGTGAAAAIAEAT